MVFRIDGIITEATKYCLTVLGLSTYIHGHDNQECPCWRVSKHANMDYDDWSSSPPIIL